MKSETPLEGYMGGFGKMDIPEFLISYLSGDFLYSPELQAFWMAFQGAVAVRSGPNKDRSMHWFHAFLLSVVAAYGGACFTPLWMGSPTSMLFNDLNVAACIAAYVLINYMPFDIGYKIGKSFPVVIVTTTFAQLFRSLGVVKYTTVCYQAFMDSPSAYYPIPVFGPIAYGTLLGNMSGFFLKGFNGYLAYGMPWPFQNGTRGSIMLVFLMNTYCVCSPPHLLPLQASFVVHCTISLSTMWMDPSVPFFVVWSQNGSWEGWMMRRLGSCVSARSCRFVACSKCPRFLDHRLVHSIV